jgi:uncharacterized protein (DUF1015 family)
MKKFEKIALAVPKVLLPKKDIDLKKWSVIACDQFTSDIQYWKEVENIVADNPSTLNLILPEIYLDKEDRQERLEKINKTMKEYLQNGILEEKGEGFVYVERQLSSGKIRKGLIVLIDLEQYDYYPDSVALMRATEKTVIERIPPRVEIRKGASVEIPHIMVLIHDQDNEVLGQIKGNKELYDFELMMGGGRVKGSLVDDETEMQKIAENLEKLNQNGLLYAVGDGNHSLASAKECWEKAKDEIMEMAESPDSFCNFLENSELRYVMVELVNLYDESLEFEPIHRILFDVDKDDLKEKIKGNDVEIEIISTGKAEKIKVGNNIRELIDEYVINHPEVKIDFIHEKERLFELAKDKNVGILLPVVNKEDLFNHVWQSGPYPRKTFSMGDGKDKRYYVEARKIREV